MKNEIAAHLAAHLALAEEEVLALLTLPPSPELGDYAFPCFRFAKEKRMAPAAIAAQLQEALSLPAYITALAAGPYLNFRADPVYRTRQTLERVLAAGENYAALGTGTGKTVCIDYSSINIAKRCHIGHLTTTALGASLCNIYKHLGWQVVGINHLGDWGTQFGKLIWAYKEWGSREAVEKSGIDELVALYVRFEKEQTPEMLDEARHWFLRIEQDDPEALSLFEWFKDLTLADVSKIYRLMDIHFDYYTGESFYKNMTGEVVSLLKEKGLLTESEGAQVVNLDAYNLPPCLILKSDGATIYATRDLAAALYRQRTYHFDKCLYVVAYQQSLHFQQLFKVLSLMRYPWAANMEHVSFGMVSFEGQTLSTRKGLVVFLDELLTRAVEKAYAIICEKSPSLQNKEEVARQVGVGSVVFYDLYNSRIKDVDFWWDRALNFDGETGPYVQYAHARCASVLRKGADISAAPDYAALANEEARAVTALLEAFPETVAAAAEKNEPFLIARFAVSLAQSFNRYYYEHKILEGAPGQASARLALCRAVKNVLALALKLLNITAPERM